MKELYISKVRYLLLIVLSIVIGTVKLSAQCALHVDDILITTKPAFCSNDGAIEVSIANSSTFKSITFGVTEKGTSNWIVDRFTTNTVMSGFIPGEYTLEVTVTCDTGSPGGASQIVTKDFSIINKTNSTIPVSASVNQSVSKFVSFNSYHSGEISINLSGGNENYIIEMTEHPAAYNGQTLFMASSAGQYLISKLAPTSTSVQEYYTFKITDGCHNEIYLTGILINRVAMDLPASLSDIGKTNATVTPRNKYSGLPAHYNKDIFIEYSSYTYYVHEFLNYSSAKDYYEVGFSYTNNAPTSVTDWQPMNSSRSNHIFKGDYYAGQIRNNPNSVGASGTLPYMYIRLKENHNTWKVYNTIKASVTNPDFYVYPESGGLRIVISSLGLHSSSSSFITLPYQLQAVDVSNNSNVIQTPTISVPADPDNAPKSEFDKKPDDIFIPWGSGSGKWKLQIKGVPDGLYGDPTLAFDITTFDVSSKDAYFTPKWSFSHSVFYGCGPTFGKNIYTSVSLNLNKGDSQIIPRYDKIKATQIEGPSNSSQGFLDVYEPVQYESYISLNSADGENNVWQKMLPGLYKWQLDVYYENGTVANTQYVEYRIIDPGEMKIDETKTLDIEKIPSGECYGTRIKLKMSQLQNIALKKAANPGSNWEVADVRIFFLEKKGDSYIPTDKAKIVPANFNFTTKNSSSITSGKPSNISFLYSDIVNFSTLPANTDPEFFVSVAGDYAVGVLPAYDTKVDYLGVDRPSSEGASPISWGTNYTTDCAVIFDTPISGNDLSAAQLNENRSGAYRCDPGTLGTYAINVTSTRPSGSVLEYKIYASNAAGQKDAVKYYHEESTSALTLVCPGSKKIPTGVDYLRVEVKPEGCDVAAAIYILPVYSLKTSSLLGSSGGAQCVNGSSTGIVMPLELYATWLPDTEYQWYYPDGTAVETTSGINGNTNHATIPISKIQFGNYKCMITNTVSCPGEPYEHDIYISEDGGLSLYWAVDAINSNWHYAANWRTSDGQVSLYTPDKCTDVIIPGKVDAYFPDLTVNSSIQAYCRNITFRYGAQLYHSEILDYDKAIVEYNVGYYNQSYPADDSSVTYPIGNRDEGLQPEAGGGYVTGLETMKRNRWWMIAGPLKDIFSGEFQFDGKPYTYQAVYNSVQDKTPSYVYKAETADNEYISIIDDNNVKLSDNYNAMMLWVPAYNLSIGGAQDELQAKYGKIVCASDRTSFNKFDMLTLNITGSNTVVRNKVGRFIFEDNSDNAPVNRYQLTIKAEPGRANGLVMIGNPFMAPIDMQSFMSANSTLVEGSFRILTETGWQTYTPSQLRYLAPLQAFVIKLKNPTATATLNFDYTVQTTVANGRTIRLK